MSKWRVVKTHSSTVKADGKHHKPGDFISYTRQLEELGLIEPVPEKAPPKGKKTRRGKKEG